MNTRHRPLSRVSLQWKLPIAICALLVLVTLTLSWIAYAHVERAARASAAERLESLSQQLVAQLTDETRQFGQTALAIANGPGVHASMSRTDAASRAAAGAELAAALRDTNV